MFSKRSLSALSSTERQLLRNQWLRSGQCARCFHASVRRGEGEANGKSNAAGPSNNVPKRGETRQQRSARISSEIAMLQKGPPPSTSSASTGESTGPGSATGAFHAPPAAPGSDAGFLETSDEMGGAEQRMGENVSTGREGPNAQGVGRPLRTEQDAMGGIEPNPGHHREWVKRSGRSSEEEDFEEEDIKNTAQPKPTPIKPTPHKHHDLLHAGAGASTIAGGNFEGVIRDRIKATSFPHHPSAEPHRWHTKGNGMKKDFKEHLVNKLVKGQYDRRDLLGGKKFAKQPVLNDVARMVLLKGSYLAGDGRKLLGKVRSLLPKPAAAAPKTQGQKAKRAQQVKK